MQLCSPSLPGRICAARGDPRETRGCCSASRMCCEVSVSSQQHNFRGPGFKQESEITCLWYPNIVAREEHLVSRPGTTYSKHYSLRFPRSPVPSSIPRLSGAETRFSKLSIPPCPSAPCIPAFRALPGYAQPQFSPILVNMI